MSDPTEDDLLAEIYALCEPDELQPGEFTCQMMSDRYSGGAETWRKKLNRLVEKGQLTRRTLYRGRAGFTAYKKAPGA